MQYFPVYPNGQMQVYELTPPPIPIRFPPEIEGANGTLLAELAFAANEMLLKLVNDGMQTAPLVPETIEFGFTPSELA